MSMVFNVKRKILNQDYWPSLWTINQENSRYISIISQVYSFRVDYKKEPNIADYIYIYREKEIN